MTRKFLTAVLVTLMGLSPAFAEPVDTTATQTLTNKTLTAPIITTPTINGTISGTAAILATGSTTARTFADRFAEVLNVKDYGALCDGATDDTTAFQAVATIGGAIFVPAGDCVINNVTLTASVSWFGEGDKSRIIKKANSAGTGTQTQSFLFNITNPNITVRFESLKFDGNYTNQTQLYTGVATFNNAEINGFVAGTTNGGGGGFLNTQSLSMPSVTDRLIVTIDHCTITKMQAVAIYFDGWIDISNYQELNISNSNFSLLGPSIIEYHDGVSTYDNIVYPASGYSTHASGLTSAFVYITDYVKANIHNNSFVESRNPLAGSITTGYDYNMYNLPGSGIVVTIDSEGTSDNSPEWATLLISDNYFEGLGRTYSTGNGIGVIDFYARGGPATITGNIIRNSYAAGVRGKSNAQHVVIANNVIDHVTNEFGINLGPNTYPSQKGNYTITGNVVRSTGAGITVTGSPTPPENTNPSIPDDTDVVVNNLVIANNVVTETVGITFSNPVLNNALAQYGWGIQVRYGAEVSITGNVVKTVNGTSTANNEHGIWVRNTKSNVTVENNVIDGVTATGILVQSHAGQASVIGNNISNTGVLNPTPSVSGYGIFVSNTGANIISNNHVKSTGQTGITAGGSTSTSVLATGNSVEDVNGNSTSGVYGIDSGATTSGAISFIGNHVKDVVNTNTGPAYGMRVQFATLANTNAFTLEGNTVEVTDESCLFLSGIYGAIIGNSFQGCNISGSTAHGAILINGTANVGVVEVIGNRVDSGLAPFPTTGGAAGDTMRNGGALREAHNSWQSKQTARAAAPTSGTWAAGDIVWNTGVSAGGFIGWVCTTAGSPGTWKTFGAVTP